MGLHTARGRGYSVFTPFLSCSLTVDEAEPLRDAEGGVVDGEAGFAGYICILTKKKIL